MRACSMLKFPRPDSFFRRVKSIDDFIGRVKQDVCWSPHYRRLKIDTSLLYSVMKAIALPVIF